MSANPLRLEDIAICFEGLLPASIATASPDGTPNVSFVSQVYHVDSRHVAISFQFFNTTKRNVLRNPQACVMVVDPFSLNSYRLRVRFARSENSGPLYERMSLQLQAIASHTGMSEVFWLQAADIYEVLEIERLEGLTTMPPSAVTPPPPPIPELDHLRMTAEKVTRATRLDELLDDFLLQLELHFGFRHSILLLADEGRQRLQTIASRGYAENGVGSEITIGEGLIGVAARARRPTCVGSIDQGMRYVRAIQDVERGREIPLPGLADVKSQLAVPLTVRGELLGVIALESPEAVAFGFREENIVATLAHQLALAIFHLRKEADEASAETPAEPVTTPAEIPSRRESVRKICFYRADDCIFVDGEYLIRNVPGRILWRLLGLHAKEGRTEFTNRELRLDSWLGLPELKDNLETRLILLRKRLEQKCPDVRLLPRGRGRFALELACRVELTEV